MEGFDEPEDVPISEATFLEIQGLLRRLYMDTDVPKEMRRRILEASVRAPEDWHRDAIQAAYNEGDDLWRLTAVFCMRYVRGFDDQILEALESEAPDIQYEAVCAAGNWELDAAWPHVADLVAAPRTDKPLLLAAIEAVASIRPVEAAQILVDLTKSDDEDIAEAAHEALAMAEGFSETEWDEEDDEDYFR
jgi:hypothetical protein